MKRPKSIKAKLIWLFLLISLVVTATVGTLGYYFCGMALKEQLLNSLTSVAESREAAVLWLLKFRLQLLEVLAANEALQSLVHERNKQEQGEKIDGMRLERQVKSFFETELVEFGTATDFFDYLIIGKSGKVYYSGDKSLIGADFSKEERFIKGMRRPFLTDVRFDPQLKRYVREMAVPIFPHQAAHEEAMGVVLGVMIATTGTEVLNEITTNREGLGETGEVYIVNKDGLMITESRFIKDAVLKQKVDTAPVRLFQKDRKIMAGIYHNYRNVLAAGASMGDELIQEFPELGWVVLAEMDVDEFLMPVFRLRNIIIFCGLLIFIIAILIAVAVSRPIETALRESEALIEQQKEELSVTLSSIGDGVIATDTQGRITLINQVAQSLTGYSEKEALGKPLEEVFRIVNEATRLRCTNPVRRVLESGQIIGLANSTLLIAKDGRERVLDDSGSPIRDKDKNIIGVVLIFRDITEKREREDQINRVNEFNEMLLKTLPLPVDIIDEECNIIFASDKTQAIFGQGLKGKKCFTLYKDDKKQCSDCPLKNGIELGETKSLEVKGVADGKTMLITYTGMVYEGRKVILEIFSDITEIEALQEKLEKNRDILAETNQELIQGQKAALNMLEDLQKSKDVLEENERKLKEALQAKSAFTSMVSHELRTPLAALKESVSLVSEGIIGPINEEQKRFLGIAKSNVDRLARLINEVLDFQTLESGKVAFKMEENDINAVIKEVRETMLGLAEKKNLDFTLNLDENLPKVRFDRDKINQVLTNLVGNSIKLTEKGSISITTSLGNNVIQASIQDTGPGIKEEDMPRLFQQYEQLERKVGGTGLGLAISLDIIKAHGGKIWAESKFGQGTTFHFALPIKERRTA